jgi:hypothetical protein
VHGATLDDVFLALTRRPAAPPAAADDDEDATKEPVRV